MSEPTSLPLDLIVRLHDRQTDLHGGLAGTGDPGLLGSAIARPLNACSCGEGDLFTLASLYAAELIRNHPFLDGNKRIGFLSALLFLEANGRKMAAPIAERLAFTLQLAASEIDEKSMRTGSPELRCRVNCPYVRLDSVWTVFQGHFTTGGMLERMLSTLPPVFRPKVVPRS